MSILGGLSASAIVMEIRQYSWDRNYAQNPVKENLILYVFEHRSWSQVVNYLRLEYTKHTIFNTRIWHSRTSLRVAVCPEELNLACSLWQFYWGAKGIVCTVTMFSYSQCRFLAFHSISVDYFRIICGNERRVLLQLCTGQSLLVVQDAGVEDRAGSIAFFKCLSLW